MLAAAGLQVRAELEQLDADVEHAIAAVAAQPVADRDGVFGWGQIDRIAEVAHRVEGLAAASVFGAPVPVATFELALGRRGLDLLHEIDTADPEIGRTLEVMRRHQERDLGSVSAGIGDP